MRVARWAGSLAMDSPDKTVERRDLVTIIAALDRRNSGPKRGRADYSGMITNGEALVICEGVRALLDETANLRSQLAAAPKSQWDLPALCMPHADARILTRDGESAFEKVELVARMAMLEENEKYLRDYIDKQSDVVRQMSESFQTALAVDPAMRVDPMRLARALEKYGFGKADGGFDCQALATQILAEVCADGAG